MPNGHVVTEQRRSCRTRAAARRLEPAQLVELAIAGRIAPSGRRRRPAAVERHGAVEEAPSTASGAPTENSRSHSAVSRRDARAPPARRAAAAPGRTGRRRSRRTARARGRRRSARRRVYAAQDAVRCASALKTGIGDPDLRARTRRRARSRAPDVEKGGRSRARMIPVPSAWSQPRREGHSSRAGGGTGMRRGCGEDRRTRARRGRVRRSSVTCCGLVTTKTSG